MKKREGNKKKPIVVAALILVGVVGIWRYLQVRRENRDGQQYTEVKAEVRDLRIAVQANGTVQPENRLAIKAPINGRIEKIQVEEGDRVRAGQTLATMSSTERAALLDAARAKGREEVVHWEELYKPTPIVAPMGGVVIARSVEPGQTITSQDAIFVISDRLLVVAQVDETDMAKVKVKQPVVMTLDAYAEHKLAGTVHRIAFEAKTVNNVTVYEVQVLPEMVPDFMRSGMTASVEFVVSEARDALTIPTGALRYEAGQTFVLLAAPNGSEGAEPIRRNIRIGATDGRAVEVVEGINRGDTVLQDAVTRPETKPGTNPFNPWRRRPSGSSSRGSGGGRAHP